MIVDILKSKTVLFITTKEPDYIRNSQEIRLIQENAKSVKIVSSDKRNYLGRILSVWKKIIHEKRKDGFLPQSEIVFIGFAPQLVLPFFSKVFKNKVVVIDFFISVYDTLIWDRKKFRDKGVVSHICHKLDEVTIKKANYIIADTKAHSEYYINEFRAPKNNIEVLYLEADKSIYYPRKKKKDTAHENKIIVLYFGSILPLQGVETVLDTIQILKDEKDIFFEMIGPISDKYKKPISDNVKYYNWLTQEELAEHIANADICLAGHFNKTIMKADRTIPGKAYIYEAMKKTMILGNSTANRELFSEDDRHIFVDMGNSTDLAEKIREFKEKI